MKSLPDPSAKMPVSLAAADAVYRNEAGDLENDATSCGSSVPFLYGPKSKRASHKDFPGVVG